MTFVQSTVVQCRCIFRGGLTKRDPPVRRQQIFLESNHHEHQHTAHIFPTPLGLRVRCCQLTAIGITERLLPPRIPVSSAQRPAPRFARSRVSWAGFHALTLPRPRTSDDLPSGYGTALAQGWIRYEIIQYQQLWPEGGPHTCQSHTASPKNEVRRSVFPRSVLLPRCCRQISKAI